MSPIMNFTILALAATAMAAHGRHDRLHRRQTAYGTQAPYPAASAGYHSTGAWGVSGTVRPTGSFSTAGPSATSIAVVSSSSAAAADESSASGPEPYSSPVAGDAISASSSAAAPGYSHIADTTANPVVSSGADCGGPVTVTTTEKVYVTLGASPSTTLSAAASNPTSSGADLTTTTHIRITRTTTLTTTLTLVSSSASASLSASGSSPGANAPYPVSSSSSSLAGAAASSAAYTPSGYKPAASLAPSGSTFTVLPPAYKPSPSGY